MNVDSSVGHFRRTWLLQFEAVTETGDEGPRIVEARPDSEDVEIGTREHDFRAVLREPAGIGAAYVVDGASRRDVRADAAKRSEEGSEVG
jgi:hypothetical protein